MEPDKRSNPRLRGLVVGFASAGLLAAGGCQTGGPDGARPAAPLERYVAKPDASGVQRIQVLAGSYFFRPGRIVVKANTPVELLASREAGITPHNLVIRAPDAGVAVEQDLGTEPRRIAFTPTKPGKYAIYCSKKPPFGAAHRERGMEGVLEVLP